MLAFETQPSSTISGSPITPGVTVRILDAGGNLFASTAPVTVAMGTNPAGGTLSGNVTVAAVAGSRPSATSRSTRLGRVTR